MTAFLLRYWKPLGALAILAAILGFHYFAVVQAGKAGREKGRAEVRAEWMAAQAAAEARHAARLEESERVYAENIVGLQGRLAAALREPAVRYVRVPVSADCPAPEPGDAGVPDAGAAPGYVEVADPGYPVFRDWLLRYAGASSEGGGGASAVPDRGEGRVAAVSELF